MSARFWLVGLAMVVLTISLNASPDLNQPYTDNIKSPNYPIYEEDT